MTLHFGAISEVHHLARGYTEAKWASGSNVNLWQVGPPSPEPQLWHSIALILTLSQNNASWKHGCIFVPNSDMQHQKFAQNHYALT